MLAVCEAAFDTTPPPLRTLATAMERISRTSTAATKSDAAKGSMERAVRRAAVGASASLAVPTAALPPVLRSCATSTSMPMATSTKKSKRQSPTESKYCCAPGAFKSQTWTPDGLWAVGTPVGCG